MTSSQVWDEKAARRYDATSAEMFAPEVLGPTVDLLAELAGDGPALELAIGTGRVALPLQARGVAVSGIELSEHMAAELRAKDGAETIPVALGDMATTRVPGAFSLVYVVYNSISNLLTQDEQVACFQNAARHLRPGGRFLIELGVPDLRRLPPGQLAVPFHVTAEHLGFYTYDLLAQRLTSHHHWPADGESGTSEHRYIWPAECDLMARLAGLEPEHRYAGFDRSPFTGESTSHVSVWRRPA